ncbi:MAG: hypothetical protein KKC71_03195 [Chloroflexi bacterium]|nr:hypothetical protein [Chloroflexota bacterium]
MTPRKNPSASSRQALTKYGLPMGFAHFRLHRLSAFSTLSALTGLGAHTPAAVDPSPYPEPDIRSRLEQLLEWHQFMK